MLLNKNKQKNQILNPKTNKLVEDIICPMCGIKIGKENSFNSLNDHLKQCSLNSANTAKNPEKLTDLKDVKE